MWPPGHIAIAYLLYSGSTRWRFDAAPSHGAVIVVGFASLFPDLVDKPLAWQFGVLPAGRTLAHSLLVLVPLSLVVYLIARRYDRGEWGIAFAIGAISHSLVDAVPALWNPYVSAGFLLWPFLPIETYESGSPSVLELLMNSLTSLYFLSEFVFLALALVVWRHDGYPGLDPVLRLVKSRRAEQ